MRAVVIEFLDALLPGTLGTIITGKNNQSVLGKSFVIEKIQYPPNMKIGFDHELTITTCITFSPETF